MEKRNASAARDLNGGGPPSPTHDITIRWSRPFVRRSLAKADPRPEGARLTRLSHKEYGKLESRNPA